MDYSPPKSSVHGVSQVRILKWVSHSLLQSLPDPEIKATSPALQADSLPAELPGKSMQGVVDHNKDLLLIVNILESHANLNYIFQHHSSYFEKKEVVKRCENFSWGDFRKLIQ